MDRIDERLERRFASGLRPMPSPTVDQLEQRPIPRTTRTGAIVVSVVVSLLIIGGLVWVRSFISSSPDHGVVPGQPLPSHPVPITPASNGVIAFADGSLLSTIDPDTGHLRTLNGVPRGSWLPAWSPDGTRLAIAVFPSGDQRQLWVVGADGSDPALIASANNIGAPSWSPDGSTIAYVAATASGSSIHIVSADGSDDRSVGPVIPPGSHSYLTASFSPDGTTLVFDKGTDSGFGIFAMDVDGSHERQLSVGTSDYNPSWSPDGRWIVFTRQEDPMESDIFAMHPDGTDVHRLTESEPGETNLNAVWSPDGHEIAYVSGHSGGPGGLVIMRTDGSAARTIIRDGVLGIDWQPIPVAP